MPILPWLPHAFVELHRAGRFDYWGAPYRSLTDDRREERMRTHRTQVLWWGSIEWDREPNAIAAFEGDDVLRPGLVPFAGNGYGDQYCWYPRWQTGPEPPVVFYVHDELESPLFAATFTQCLCRCFLQHFAQWDQDEEDRQSHPLDMQTLWDAHLAILGPYLDSEQEGLLTEVGASLSRKACEEADERIVARLGSRTLVGSQPPTSYDDDGKAEWVLRAYDRSIAFYREMVEDEGRVEFQARLDEAQAARASAAARRR
jgi:hypothetical protein